MKNIQSQMLSSLKAFFFVAGMLVISFQAHADAANDLLMPGKLIEGHAKYENECSNCHKPYDKAAQSGLCKDCHKEITKDINEKHGYHGLMQEESRAKNVILSTRAGMLVSQN